MKLKLLVFLFAAATLLYFLYVLPAKEGVRGGQKAPSFSLINESGQLVTSSQMTGSVVLLNFWATWCPSCVREIPSLNQLSKLVNNPKFKVIGVSVDEEGWPAINRFRSRVPLEFDILLDQNSTAADQFGTFQIPETFLIDKYGTIVRKYEGPRDWADPSIVKTIQQLLQ